MAGPGVSEPAPEWAAIFERAEEHFFSRRYNTSLSLFLKVLELNPEHARAHSYAGDIYLIQDKLDEAAHHFRIASEIGDEKHKSEFRLGQIAYLSGDAPAARTHLNQSLEHYPDFPPAIFYLGLVSWKLEEKREEAARHWEKYISLKPQDPQKVAIEQAISYLRTDASTTEENPSGPLDMDRLLNSVDPGSSGPSRQPVTPNSDSGSEGIQQSDSPDPGLLALAQSVKEHPERLNTVMDLSQIYRQQDEKQKALALLEEAHKHSDDAKLSTELAGLYAETGRSQQAREVLRLQLKRSDLPIKEKAYPALQMARITASSAPENAAASDESNSATNPNQQSKPGDAKDSGKPESVESLTEETSSEENQNGRLDQGTNTQTDGSETSSNSEAQPDGEAPAKAQNTEAQDYELAMEILEERQGYRHLDSENRKEYHLMQARRAFNQGNKSQAYAGALRVLKEDPTDRKGLILAATVAYQSETATSFAVYEERIRGLYANDPEMLTALARIYAEKEPEKARKQLEDLLKEHPGSPAPTLQLFRLEKSEQPEKALKRLEEALARQPDNPALLSAYIEAQIEQKNSSPKFLELLKRVQDLEKKSPGSFPELKKWIQTLPAEAQKALENRASDPSKDQSNSNSSPDASKADPKSPEPGPTP